MKKLSLLGSTGSIGTQALQVVQNLREQGEKWEVAALAARSSVHRLEEQARKFHPEVVAVFDEGAALSLRQSLRDTDIQVLSGVEGLREAAAWPGADLTLNAVVGMVGLQPTLAALQAGKALALANKETLVAGGAIVMEAARKRNLPILPVDSEHSAIFQCLQGCPERGALKKLVLTASGGPFFGRSRQELAGVTREQALRHPNWDMGAKITIDSATMMNKGLEVMEASWLFDLPEHRIEVVVHRESVIHSMVEYQDNAVVAQLGVPDMAVPIQYALTYPRRMPSPAGELDLCALGKLTFYPPDREAFPLPGALPGGFAPGRPGACRGQRCQRAGCVPVFRGEDWLFGYPPAGGGRHGPSGSRRGHLGSGSGSGSRGTGFRGRRGTLI